MSENTVVTKTFIVEDENPGGETERVRCVKLVDEVIACWAARLQGGRSWPGEYYDGAFTQLGNCLDELREMRTKMEKGQQTCSRVPL